MIWIIIAAVIGLFVFWRYLFFFRNPKRAIAINENHVLSPADGQILYIRKIANNAKDPIFTIKNKKVIKLTDLMHIDDEELLTESGYLIGIMMTPFDVHFNRAPIQGRIKKIAHDFPNSSFTDSVNRCMFNAVSNLLFDEKPYSHDCDYIITNERASFVVKNKDAAVYVTQIAERWVKRIITYKDNETIEQGEVFGMIRMGSQVDIFVPKSDKYKLKVSERQRVKAGLSVLLERT